MFKELVMMCPSLIDQGGHEHDYTEQVASAALANGMRALTILPKSAPKRLTLPGHVEDILPAYGHATSRLIRLFQAAPRAYAYFRIFTRFGTPETLWFVHSATHNELAIITLAWLLYPYKKQKLALFIRQEIAPSKKFLLALFQRASRHGISFVSDGDELAEIMGRRLHTQVTHVPIPIHPLQPCPQKPAHLLCGYFGAKRPSKGFQNLANLIEALRNVKPQTQFVIQAYKHRDDEPNDHIDSIADRLKKTPGVRLIEKVLSSETFRHELMACSIILLPYQADVYRTATSGIFVMAIATKAVVIVTEGTWMAKQTKKHKLSRVVLMPENPSPEQAAKAVKKAHNLLNASPQPEELERQWIAQQSKEKVLDTLTS